MAEDRLEKFVKDNQQAFDNKEPSAAVWSQILRQLEAAPSAPWTWVWKAAAIIFFCTSLYLFINPPQRKLDVLAQKEKVADDFEDVESFYFQIISQKRELIYTYDAIENPIEVDFEQDLQKLDAMYEVLKEELHANPSKKVVDALILNLLVRIDVLNEKIEELEGGDEEELPEGTDI